MLTPTYASSLPTSRAVLRQADHFSALTGQGPVRLARAVLRLRAAALAAASHGHALHPALQELLARVALIRSSHRVGTSRLDSTDRPRRAWSTTSAAPGTPPSSSPTPSGRERGR